MGTGEIRAPWDAIDRAGTDNVCVIFRPAGTESPLESAQLAFFAALRCMLTLRSRNAVCWDPTG